MKKIKLSIVTFKPFALLMARSGLKTLRTRKILTALNSSLLFSIMEKCLQLITREREREIYPNNLLIFPTTINLLWKKWQQWTGDNKNIQYIKRLSTKWAFMKSHTIDCCLLIVISWRGLTISGTIKQKKQTINFNCLPLIRFQL